MYFGELVKQYEAQCNAAKPPPEDTKSSNAFSCDSEIRVWFA